MKNNKTTTYILIVIVMGLWIVVFYRVYKSFFADDEMAIVSHGSVTKKKINVQESEVFVLKANYPDPFMGNVVSGINYNGSSGVVKKSILKKEKPKVEKVKIDWSFIRYIGLIKNQQSKKQVALVSINGREFMASEGNVIENVSFLKNYRDSIKVSFQGASAFIKK